jgi:hypothetical protein
MPDATIHVQANTPKHASDIAAAFAVRGFAADVGLLADDLEFKRDDRGHWVRIVVPLTRLFAAGASSALIQGHYGFTYSQVILPDLFELPIFVVATAESGVLSEIEVFRTYDEAERREAQLQAILSENENDISIHAVDRFDEVPK